jgi:hypothetical protein
MRRVAPKFFFHQQQLLRFVGVELVMRACAGEHKDKGFALVLPYRLFWLASNLKKNLLNFEKPVRKCTINGSY